MDEQTLTLLEKSAHSGAAHPVDVLRLVEEVRRLRVPDAGRYEAYEAWWAQLRRDGVTDSALVRATWIVAENACRHPNPEPLVPGTLPLWGAGTDPSPTIKRDLRAVCEQVRRDAESTTGKDSYIPSSEYPGAVDTFIPFGDEKAAQELMDRLKAGEIIYDPRRIAIPRAKVYEMCGLTPPPEEPGPQSFSKSDDADTPTVVGEQ